MSSESSLNRPAVLTRGQSFTKYFLQFIPFLFIVFFQLLGVYLFFSRERFIYYFDYGGYEGVVNSLASRFPDDWRGLLTVLKASLSTDYNIYYTLPLIPLVRILRPDRLSYLLGVTLIYQIPFTLAVGYLFSQLIGKRPRVFFWLAVFIAAILPNTWAPTFRGYPDIVGTLFICLALGIYLRSYGHQKWWQYLAVGFCLAWAAIFRRYNLYSCVAFFGLAGIMLLIDFVQGKNWRAFFWKGFSIGLAGLVLSATLYIFNKPFLINAISTNYVTLYSSYMVNVETVRNFFVSQYGLLIWAMALAGYVLAFWTMSANRKALAFVFLWGMAILLCWIFYVRQVGIHYTLSISIFITIGLASFLYIALTHLNRIPKRMVVGLILVFLFANYLRSFAYISFGNNSVFPGRFFSEVYPPLYRGDFSEAMRLIDYMRSIAPNRETVYVVDSSSLMNYDILLKGEQQRFPGEAKLNLLVPPQIDSRDYYPLEPLILADYVLVSSPFQQHVQGDNQRVAKYVYEAFQNQWEFTKDFVELPESFQLGDGTVTLRVYQRVRPTDLGTSITTLKQLQEYIPQRPGSQKDWILLTKLRTPGIFPGQVRDFSFVISPEFLSGESSIQFLYIEPVPTSGKLIIELKDLSEPMPNLVFDVFVYDRHQQKTLQTFQTVWKSTKDPVISIPFTMEPNPDTGFVSLIFQVRREQGAAQDLPGNINLEYELHIE